MTDYFPQCCAFSLQQEGGFCNVAGDPGGATNHGVTMEVLSAVLGRQATVDDVRQLTTAQAQAIYRPHYWLPVAGDLLPAGVNLVTFDFGINAGPQRSAMLLQGAVGVMQDGYIGPETLAAVTSWSPNLLIASLTNAHEAYYEQLPTFSQFGAGWLARVQRCETAAFGMAGAA